MPAASCTLLGWLSAILKVLTLIGPASEYICYLPQPYQLMIYTSLHYSANILALKGEQDSGWGGTDAEHSTLLNQWGQPSVTCTTMHLLTGKNTEHHIPETSHQSPYTAELLSE